MYRICVTSFFMIVAFTCFIIYAVRLKKQFSERIIYHVWNRSLSPLECVEYFAMSIAYIGIEFTGTKEYKSRREWETSEMGAQQRNLQKCDHFVVLQQRFLGIRYSHPSI